MTNMNETLFDKATVTTMLSTGAHQICFYKTDGSVRDMTCTKDLDLIPEVDHPSGTGKRSSSDTTVTVYDMEANGWRSFVLENLITIDGE